MSGVQIAPDQKTTFGVEKARNTCTNTIVGENFTGFLHTTVSGKRHALHE